MGSLYRRILKGEVCNRDEIDGTYKTLDYVPCKWIESQLEIRHNFDVMLLRNQKATEYP